MSPILIRKRAHQIIEHAYHQTAHFFMSQNDHIRAKPSVLTMLQLTLITPYTFINYEW